MGESLRYYLAFNGGLQVLERRNGASRVLGEHFERRTLEHLTGGRARPEVVFAAVAFDGGYRSIDGGRSWRKVLDGDIRTFTIDARDERVVYAGAGPVRLFRSEDGGESWEPLDGLLEQPERVKAQWTVPERYRGRAHPHVRYVLVHPDDADLLYVLLEHGGVLASRDRGLTWEDRSAGIPYLDMHVIRNYPGSRERYCVSSARGFFRSDDSGRSWRRVEKGMPWGYTELYSYSHDWLFLGGNPPRMLVGSAKGSPGVWSREKRDPDGALLVSDDGGESWRVCREGLPAHLPWMPWALLPHPEEADTVFAAMGDGARGFGFDPKIRGRGALYVSRDRGDSWEPLLLDMPSILTAWVAPA